ncbi:hypothetical protein PFICI_02474 [Pestalotiopsis fici W106-1]|uniref:Zn(2)-C6 fungal-type domain-containing protein n=1 Tax=Pestalotiopsis fici (strain W106-1 / CGMCC3.15140) TaxID=1229662 RepID=W3XEK6_PESFW|nr:uncharacterized protein PFICI_02474 [Pestalotiopsis fici W106-1]ETS84449.1 hypothetical protein PFICI_02474 [Pestalotiopsis fici W106-1]
MASSPKPRRSRGGCWTCRRRHKKCDEVRPICLRCQHGDFQCEGYGVRLTWSEGDAPRDVQQGVAVRPFRRRRRMNRLPAQDGTEARLGGTGPSGAPSGSDVGAHLDEHEMYLLCSQYQDDMRQTSQRSMQREVEERLLKDFSTSGYLTLTGRSGPDNLFSSEIIPLCETRPALRHAFVAYQAGLEDDCQSVTASYLQLALSEYSLELQQPERLQEDATLATGILLCSVSINSSYIWTPLLRGLYYVLQSRRLLEHTRRDRLTQHLLEVVGLLDLPHFTLNRLNKPLHIWDQFVAPYKSAGVEESTGLPYSLLNILADIALPDTEDRLLAWPGEVAQDLIQIHLWEAYRTAAILHSRMLKIGSGKWEWQGDTTQQPCAKPGLSNSILLMKAFASVQAICDSKKDAYARPLASAVLYPLFIASICTHENTKERSIAKDLFHAFRHQWERLENQLEWEFVLEIWERSRCHTRTTPLDLATQFARELNIEVHLY